jgi:short-chain fatty acids transporter
MGIIIAWYGGFWSLLAFSMQMALVLVTGYTLALTPVFRKILSGIAGSVSSPKMAIAIVTMVSTIASFLNWGFGLVIGAILAREVAKKVKGIDYRLLIASAYSGFLVWHGGLSGSIPLQLASNPVESLSKQTMGAVTANIPLSYTIFSPLNLVILIALFIVLPIINVAMSPVPEDTVEVDPALLVDPPEVEEKPFSTMTPAEKMENSPVVSLLLFLMGIAAMIWFFKTKGFGNLGLDIVNFIFLFFGILLHKTPKKFLVAFAEATKGAAGVLLQFPFYAGIMGIMTGKDAAGTSLALILSNFFVNISTAKTFPMFSFWSAGVVNFFVPSGGGQWVVQAPIVMPGGLEIGTALGKEVEYLGRSAMAIAWGDAWTNMVQPFWALPALGIAGLGAKDVMGYLVMVLILSGVVISGAFLIL